MGKAIGEHNKSNSAKKGVLCFYKDLKGKNTKKIYTLVHEKINSVGYNMNYI
jgi:DNA-binding protein Fis